MPQIRCPNCGLTINLENRRETDTHLITNAVKSEARTFTDLLNITGLPRKTLSIRLKELCRTGVLDKTEGSYQLNSLSSLRRSPSSYAGRFSRIAHDNRMKAALMLSVLLIGFPTLSFALAALYPAREPVVYQQPQVLGAFTAVLTVDNVSNLYAWQVVVVFNSSELRVEGMTLGKGFANEIPGLLNATNIGDGQLMVGSALLGNASGLNGDLELARIVFGYYAGGYKECPQIAQSSGVFDTVLMDSKLKPISTSDSPLNLRILP